MSSGSRGRFGLRLAQWYATLFVCGAIIVASLTYYVTATSLAQRDQEIIQSKLGEYATVYARRGLDALVETVRNEQLTTPERLYVRVVDRGAEALVLSSREGWDPRTLETASLQLLDGTLVEVGKSIETRIDLLRRVRAALGFGTLAIVLIALTGGWLATEAAVAPIRRLTDTAGQIVRTGRTDQRVTVSDLREDDDAIVELMRLFNAMLDKIEGLVRGMRAALDNVAHDLRTPLTRLRGTAELTLASPPDIERYREALADCVEESDRVLVMLNTLMDISEAESGAMPLQHERVMLADVAARALDLYRDVADAKDITLESKTDPNVAVSGDRVRLEQVAANLIDNAIKYTPDGGGVKVVVTGDGTRARLSVQDNGVGISPEEQPRIWDRLFRGDRSRTERGLGLGLSLVKAIVNAHGGTVSVESAPGKGSTFTVSLPLSRDLEGLRAEG